MALFIVFKTSETGSMSAYDAGFLDDKSEALPGGYPRKITLNNQCTTVHKKQGSLKKGFTTNQKTDVILSRTKSAGERVSRPRSAGKKIVLENLFLIFLFFYDLSYYYYQMSNFVLSLRRSHHTKNKKRPNLV